MTERRLRARGSLRAGSTKVTVTGDAIGALNGGGVVLDIDQAQIDHDLLSGTHAVTSETLFVNTLGKSVASTSSETTLLNTGVGSATLAADYLAAGKTIRVTAFGYFSTKAAPAGNITLSLKLGSVEVVATAAFTMPDGSSNELWRVDGVITGRSVGATGTCIGQAMLLYKDGTATRMISFGPATSTVVVDTTGTLAVDLTAQWGTSDASNAFVCTNIVVEGLM